MNIHFNLRQQGKDKPTIVLEVFDSRFEHRKFLYSSGIKIDRTDWDKRKGRVKSILGREKELSDINKHLNFLEQSTISFMGERHALNELFRKDLKAHLSNTKVTATRRSKISRTDEDFFDTWEKIISESKTAQGIRTTEGTRKQKRQTASMVKKFSTEQNFPVSFETIDMTFYHSFDTFLIDKGMNGNSRGKHFKEIKALLREAVDRDIKVNMAFQKKSFKVIKTSPDNTYLNSEELRKILKLPLADHLQVHRDIFVMACFVGARHSDWSQIRKSNIVSENGKELLKMKQTKTKKIVHIPVHPVVRILLNKYNGEPPKAISNQKFNECIKDICEDAKLGQVSIDGINVDKHTQITTHTARRSFATNAYLSKSMEVYQIMKCTGHTTEASFLQYLKLDGKDFAIEAADSKFFNNTLWSDLLLAS